MITLAATAPGIEDRPGAASAAAVAMGEAGEAIGEIGNLAGAVRRRLMGLLSTPGRPGEGARTIPAAAAPRRARSPMATADRSDESLMAAYLEGDRGAFASLVERHRAELHGFLARFLGSSAAADDVFQETFLQVHVAASSFDPARTFKPWLFTIAANKARDWHRRQKRRRAASLDAPASSDADGARLVDLMQSGSEAPGAALEVAETKARVKELVDGLPAVYREVLQLNYFQKMSYQQISEVLGVPLGTVKSRLHSAVATFADAWKTSAHRAARRSGASKESTA